MTQDPEAPRYAPPAPRPVLPPSRRRRGLRFVLLLLVMLFIGGGILGALYVFFFKGPDVRVAQGTWLVADVGGEYPEERPGGDGDWADVLEPTELSAQDLTTALWRAAEDGRVAGVILRPDGFGGGWAQAQEIRQALAAIRAAGKPVWAYVTAPTPAAYYLASAAQAIAVAPEGRLFLLGLRARLEFLKGSLDKLGVEAEFIAIGEYKSAPEQLTRQSPTEANRRQISAFLDDVYAAWVQAIAQGRALSPEVVEEHVERSHFPAEDAVRAGLADHVLDLHQLYDHVGLDVEDPEVIGPLSYVRADYDAPSVDRSRRLALVYATGEIRPGPSGRGSFSGRVLGSRTVIDRLRRAREDDKVKAVIFRVDSPGGSVLASDLIWREVERVRQAKPVVVSMGNYAASGGYYVSMSADRVFANPLTLTGSIGVYMGKVNVRGLYEKLGLSFEVIKRGRNADFFSELESFSPDQRSELQGALRAFYDRFLAKVADGRSLTPEEVDEVARGRVWSGIRAMQHSLVDSLGTLHDAVNDAKRLAGISPDVRVPVMTYQRPLSFWQRVARDLLNSHVAGSSILAPPFSERPWSKLWTEVERLALSLDGTPQFRLPFNVRVE